MLFIAFIWWGIRKFNLFFALIYWGLMTFLLFRVLFWLVLMTHLYIHCTDMTTYNNTLYFLPLMLLDSWYLFNHCNGILWNEENFSFILNIWEGNNNTCGCPFHSFNKLFDTFGSYLKLYDRRYWQFCVLFSLICLRLWYFRLFLHWYNGY